MVLEVYQSDISQQAFWEGVRKKNPEKLCPFDKPPSDPPQPWKKYIFITLE